jgi:hypothetical protein
MRRFSFPLGRVMDWRGAQARIEEVKLEHLYAELRAIEVNTSALLKERACADQAVLRAAAVTGSELAALAAFRRFSVAEHIRLDRLRADCSQRIAAQLQVVAIKRRDVRLLERLKQQRFSAWSAEFNREIDKQAEESHLAQWNAQRR